VHSTSDRLTIRIHPVPVTGTDRHEQFKRAKAIAGDLKKIEGLANVESHQPLYGNRAILNTINPMITAEIVEATGPMLDVVVQELFELLRERREKKDHRKTMILIGESAYLVTNKNEAKQSEKILRQIKKLFKKNKKK
jgi:hypothetical protein